MQKKQQRNGDVGQPAKTHCDLTTGGQHAGENHYADRVSVKLSGKKRGRVVGIIRVCQGRGYDSNALDDYRLTLVSQQISPNGHNR